MSRYKRALSVIAMAVMVMSLSIVVSAQWRDGRGNRGNNDRYGNGSYGNATYNRNLDSTIRNLRDKSRNFERILDRELDRSRIDGTRREDRLNDLAHKFKDAADDLDGAYKRGRDFNRSRDEAQRVINYGSQLDRALSNSRLGRNYTLQSAWDNIEYDIRVISDAYNLNYNDRRNNRNRNDSYNRNRDRRGGYGGYGGNNGQYNRNLRATIVNLRNKSRHFEDRLDRERKYGRDNRNYNNLENLSNRFNDAVKKLEREYDDYRDYDRSYDEVRRVLSIGEQLDREISRSRVDRSIRSDWNRIEDDLRTLARAYNLRYNGSNRSIRLRDILRDFPF